MVVDEKKQLKVDNWGSFFLHRLFLLYEKGEKCDGTLLFKDGHSIKVHKLVLMTCTDYFDEHLWTNDTFTLPPVLGHGAVLPIVNFMYTGFLNFNAEIHHAVFTAAKFLNVTILMKLLHAQLDNDSLPQPDSAADNINHSTTTSEPSSSSSSASPSLSASSVPPPSASSSSSSSPSVSVVSTKSVLRKVKKLPRIGKPLFLTPQPSSSSSTSSSSNSSFSVVASSAAAAAASSSQTVPGKKLPIWKKRTTTIAGLTSSGAPRLPADYYGSVDEAAEPLPSRCHLAVGEGLAEGVPGEGQLPPRAECPAYDTYNLATPSFHHQPRTLTEDIVKEFYRLNNKRPPPHLLMKAVAMVKDAIIAHNSSSDVTAMEVDDDDDDDGLVDEPMAMDDESVLMTSGVKRPTVQYGGKSAEEKFDRLTRLATPPKPILKPLTSDCVATGGGGSSSKKVRFSLAAEGKENTASANSVTAAAVSDTPTTALATPTTPPKGGGAKAAAAAASSPLIGGSKEVMTSRVSITGDKSANLNATQIISELMKKNPDLMKNNKNIRVSIVSGGSAVTPGGRGGKTEAEKETTKVRYIVMKQQMGGGGGGGGGSGTGSPKESGGGKNGAKPNAENMTGPWLCDECGVPGHPMQFETYYLYRKHLHEVHQERIDARICEYCGYKSSKRNLHLYHLYTKHGVPPPRNIRFPKCDQCNYIALSDSLLIKHNNNHSSDKHQCKACVLTFRSQSALQTHLQSCPKSGKDALAVPAKEYICHYCRKTFNRSINLKAHMRIAHKNQSSLRSRYEEEGEEEDGERRVAAGAVNIKLTDEATTAASTSNLLQVIRLPMMDASGVEGEEEVGGERALLLPAGMFLASGGGGGGVEGGAPSSEQEAMNSVASGIAASLNLADANGHHQTVILLDGSGSELVFEPGNAVVLQPAPQDGSTVAAGCTEYIVPEVITAANQLFQAHAHTAAAAEAQQQEHEVQSLEGGLPEGTSIIVVPPDSQLTSDQLTAEETVLTTETSDTVGTPADQLASDDNSAAVVEEDKCMNIVEEACKRETIIIETSSVLGATTEVLHEQNGGDSVIVSGPRLTQQSRLDLASDWDDVESDSRGDGSDCRGDVVQRPSRATFDGVEEAILPDMI